jgi:hypothetical protein
MITNSWRIFEKKNETGHLHLGNTSATIIQFERRIDQEEVLKQLLNNLNNANVPFSYTENLREIYFTYLPTKGGDYEPGYIRISCAKDEMESIDTIFVHELGHHMDEVEGISKRKKLIEEFENISNIYKLENIHEYIATGFELFYFKKNGTKINLKKHHPKLFNCIKYLHSKYTKKGN